MAQINITNLTFAYDGNAENVFENINLSFDTTWKIGLIGRNGRGKTTLLNLLLKKYEYKGGDQLIVQAAGITFPTLFKTRIN